MKEEFLKYFCQIGATGVVYSLLVILVKTRLDEELLPVSYYCIGWACCRTFFLIEDLWNGKKDY